MKRNISIRSENEKINPEKNNLLYNIQNNRTKSPNKSSSKRLSPNRSSNFVSSSYIAKSFLYIERSNCNNPLTNSLNIDGDYGDYRMKIFRKKNKLKHLNDPKSIFENKEFYDKLFDYANCGVNGKGTENEQKNQKNDNESEINSPFPMFDRQNSITKQRGKLKRQTSIRSPVLHSESELSNKLQDAFKPKFFDESTELLNKQITDILSRPRQHYIKEKKKDIENEQELQRLKNKQMLHPGVEQQLRQKQGHLFYRNIPSYMAQKWFKTLDNSTADGNKIIPLIEEKVPEPPPKRQKYKQRHIFKFLEQNFDLLKNQQNKNYGLMGY